MRHSLQDGLTTYLRVVNGYRTAETEELSSGVNSFAFLFMVSHVADEFKWPSSLLDVHSSTLLHILPFHQIGIPYFHIGGNSFPTWIHCLFLFFSHPFKTYSPSLSLHALDVFAFQLATMRSMHSCESCNTTENFRPPLPVGKRQVFCSFPLQ